jgi:phenylpropionate dioxygenase-like ring-hydroxylating dioxygenase large terminal subunit
LECEAVFKRSWLQVGHICELPEPGTFIVRSIEIADASILITRGKDDKIRAFHNVCTHRGTQLVAEACGKKSVFSCPYHMWTFTNEGQFRGAPDMERFFVDKSECNLPKVAIDVCAGLIFISLNKSPSQSLDEFLGPLAAELEKLPIAQATTFSEYVYEVDANWKLTYDNFQENYHLRFIHPRSGAATSGDDNPFGYPSRYRFLGENRTQTIWSNPNPKIEPFQAFAFNKAAGFAIADGFDLSDKEYYGIFPNLFIMGTAMTPFTQNVTPLGAGRSRGTIRLYWKGDDDSASKRFAREYAMATALDIHCEDRAVIEAGHRGLKSGAIEYLHFQGQEVLCRHLFNTVNEKVEAYKAECKATGDES